MNLAPRAVQLATSPGAVILEFSQAMFSLVFVCVCSQYLVHARQALYTELPSQHTQLL